MVSSPGMNFLKKEPAREHAPVPDMVCTARGYGRTEPTTRARAQVRTRLRGLQCSAGRRRRRSTRQGVRYLHAGDSPVRNGVARVGVLRSLASVRRGLSGAGVGGWRTAGRLCVRGGGGGAHRELEGLRDEGRDALHSGVLLVDALRRHLRFGGKHRGQHVGLPIVVPVGAHAQRDLVRVRVRVERLPATRTGSSSSGGGGGGGGGGSSEWQPAVRCRQSKRAAVARRQRPRCRAFTSLSPRIGSGGPIGTSSTHEDRPLPHAETDSHSHAATQPQGRPARLSPSPSSLLARTS